jgi:hypothetical protein
MKTHFFINILWTNLTSIRDLFLIFRLRMKLWEPWGHTMIDFFSDEELCRWDNEAATNCLKLCRALISSYPTNYSASLLSNSRVWISLVRRWLLMVRWGIAVDDGGKELPLHCTSISWGGPQAASSLATSHELWSMSCCWSVEGYRQQWCRCLWSCVSVWEHHLDCDQGGQLEIAQD